MALDTESNFPEKRAPSSQATHGAEDASPAIPVTNNADDSQQNPRDWPTSRKWTTTIIVSLFAFISPVVSTMIAPALPSMSQDFHVAQPIKREIMLSIYVLAYAFGPLLFGPLSELYGRRHVLQLGNLVFLAFNLGCGFAKSWTQLVACRFFAGFSGSVPLSVGGGILADVWHPHQRGRAVALYSLMPFLGPAVGPIAGAFISENSTWRWCFWATSAACGLFQVVALFYLPESYSPAILRRQRAATHSDSDKADSSIGDKLNDSRQHMRTAMARPFRLLLTQPIVQVLCVYLAYLFGIIYLLLASFPMLWSSPDDYNESIGVGSLNYISLAVGLFLGSQSAAPLNDAIFSQLTARNGGVSKPEFRVPLMIPGSLMVPIGLFWYGWAAETHSHWILPNVGAAVFACGAVIVFQCIQTYIIDGYTRYAASALAASVFLRSLCAFGFPLFAPYLNDALGYGWASTVLGLVATVVGIPVPILLWKFGPALRARSQYAAGG